MAMSRKHYKELAAILADLNSHLKVSEENGCLYEDAYASFKDAVNELSVFLKYDNPNFNGTKFREAVYGKEI